MAIEEGKDIMAAHTMELRKILKELYTLKSDGIFEFDDKYGRIIFLPKK
ncbi:MAG: hypothetical protein PUF37_00820 [Prevotellaceae bacterium]|nr:hypothetical protein [Prevotellaceae bacterium]